MCLFVTYICCIEKQIIMEAVKFYLQYQGQKVTEKQGQKLIKQLGLEIIERMAIERGFKK